MSILDSKSIERTAYTRAITSKKISRQEALERGLLYYYSECGVDGCGNRLKYTASRNCTSCAQKRADKKKLSKMVASGKYSNPKTRARIDDIKQDSKDDYWDSLLDEK